MVHNRIVARWHPNVPPTRMPSGIRIAAQGFDGTTRIFNVGPPTPERLLPDTGGKMGGKGPARTGKAVRRNKTPDTVLIASPKGNKKYGWKLPTGVLFDREGEEIDWHPMTKKWWESWRTSPQATRMLTEPDWTFLLDTAFMHHMMWTNGRWDFASEVRLRVAKFGATPEDRLRLHLEIDEQIENNGTIGKADGANVTSIDARRKRLG